MLLPHKQSSMYTHSSSGGGWLQRRALRLNLGEVQTRRSLPFPRPLDDAGRVTLHRAHERRSRGPAVVGRRFDQQSARKKAGNKQETT